MFRFTIRELVLLTIIVAMGLAWWLDHRQASITRERDSAHYRQQWDNREKEWHEVNLWSRDAKNSRLRQRAMKEHSPCSVSRFATCCG
jgi:hypothetical protein